MGSNPTGRAIVFNVSIYFSRIIQPSISQSKTISGSRICLILHQSLSLDHQKKKTCPNCYFTSSHESPPFSSALSVSQSVNLSASRCWCCSATMAASTFHCSTSLRSRALQNPMLSPFLSHSHLNPSPNLSFPFRLQPKRGLIGLPNAPPRSLTIFSLRESKGNF